MGRWVLWLAMVLAWGLGTPVHGAAPQRLKVLTSFLPVYCFAANVAGDRAEVENLLPANVDPHEYQFSRRDIAKVSRADLIFINGLGLETWLDKLLRNASGSPPVLAISDGMTGELITQRPQLPGTPAKAPSSNAAPNPHIWLDPHLAMHAVTNILNALQKADPANASAYAANATSYLARLNKLEEDLAAGLAPARNTPIVTFHDAFPYFARRCQLRILGAIEVVPDIEPSPRYLSALRGAIIGQGTKAIFTETHNPSPRLAVQFARDLNLPIAPLDTLETGPLKPAAYEKGMRYNLRVLQTYLVPKTPKASLDEPVAAFVRKPHFSGTLTSAATGVFHAPAS
jgi:zinc/manganese transport system substrate-binding protein